MRTLRARSGQNRQAGVRGASANLRYQPTQTPGLVLWLQADDLTGADGDAVAAWNDKSGNNNHFAQATGTKQPLLKKAANGINGHNVVRFDGTDDLLVAANFSNAAQGSIVAVYRLTEPLKDFQTLLGSADEATTTYNVWLAGLYTIAIPRVSLAQRNNDTADEVRGGTSLTHSTPYLLVCQSSGTAYATRINGAAETLSVVTGANNGDWFGDTANRDNFSIGAFKRSSEVSPLKGDIAELLIYETALAGADLSNLERYLAERYGLTLP